MAFLSFTLAYIGPGMGGGFIAAVVGIFISIFLALFAILPLLIVVLPETFTNDVEP